MDVPTHMHRSMNFQEEDCEGDRPIPASIDYRSELSPQEVASLKDELISYTLLSVIHHSPISTVCLVRDATGATLVYKHCSKKEAQLLSKLQHPHIISIAVPLSNGYLMKQGICLRSVIQLNPYGLPLEEVFCILRQIASALSYLHAQSIVHGDITPENILLVGTVYVLCDLSNSFSGESLMATQTLTYRGPEKAFGSWSDVWGIGCLLYELATGERLIRDVYDSHQLSQFYEFGQEEDLVGRVDFLLGKREIAAVRPLLKGTLEYNPEKRMSMKEVCDYLHSIDCCLGRYISAEVGKQLCDLRLQGLWIEMGEGLLIPKGNSLKAGQAGTHVGANLLFLVRCTLQFCHFAHPVQTVSNELVLIKRLSGGW